MNAETIINLACTATIAICSAIAVIATLSNKKQRAEITFGFEPASKAEFKEHVAHNTKRHAELFRGIDDAKDECSNKVAELAKEVQALGKDMSALLATNNAQSNSIAVIQSDIKALLKKS